MVQAFMSCLLEYYSCLQGIEATVLAKQLDYAAILPDSGITRVVLTRSFFSTFSGPNAS
jgi:hypothetical protein